MPGVWLATRLAAQNQTLSGMTAFHDGANRGGGLAAARTALQNARSGDNAEGLSDQAAMRADKAVRPAGTPKIGSARRVVGKQLLKLRERAGKSQIVALVDVHSRDDGQTLAPVGCLHALFYSRHRQNYN
jgi:NAD(P)-dependent dehydrogenase (short-subunit alcohol dehydrogenase family)